LLRRLRRSRGVYWSILHPARTAFVDVFVSSGSGGLSGPNFLVFRAEPSQIRYFSNLNIGDSVIDITNTGRSGGNICVNVYVFAPDEQPIACCTCPVTTNGLNSFSVINDLIYNVLTPSVPTSVVVKLNATVVPPGGCSASAVAAPATGLVAWGTTVHGTPSATAGPRFPVTETPFTLYTPGMGEQATNANACRFLNFVGSGFGICKSCRLGGLGADHQ
jgi:hypothetical protein